MSTMSKFFFFFLMNVSPVGHNERTTYGCSVIRSFYSPVGPRKPFPILWGAARPIRRPMSSSHAPPACQAAAQAGWGLGPAAEWDSIWNPAPAPHSVCDLIPAGGGRSQVEEAWTVISHFWKTTAVRRRRCLRKRPALASCFQWRCRAQTSPTGNSDSSAQVHLAASAPSASLRHPLILDKNPTQSTLMDEWRQQRYNLFSKFEAWWIRHMRLLWLEEAGRKKPWSHWLIIQSPELSLKDRQILTYRNVNHWLPLLATTLFAFLNHSNLNNFSLIFYFLHTCIS